jgi:hypothetical protein
MVLLKSIENGTLLPYECVIGLSETSDEERIVLDEIMKKIVNGNMVISCRFLSINSL